MNRTLLLIICIFFVLNTNAYCVGIFGKITATPLLINGKYVQNAGAGVGMVVDTNWILSVSIDNSIFNNLEADFVVPINSLKPQFIIDTNLALRPQLFQNSFEFQFAYNFEINNLTSLAIASFAKLNYIYYRIVYPASYIGDQIYPDYGSSCYISLAPCIQTNFDFYRWLRISTGIAYSMPINLDYQIKNTNGLSLKNKDLNTLLLFVSLQLGDFK